MHKWLTHPALNDLSDSLASRSGVWLITGVAGFIGSNLLEVLLASGQKVAGLDNFATGHQHNLNEVQNRVGAEAWKRFTFIEGDIRNLRDCEQAVQGVDYVLHQAALGSVPRSIADPITSHDVNITGFLNMLDAARRANVGRFIYAASSSTYGDEPALPKREDRIGNPLSPYAVTKLVNEQYAAVYARCFGFQAAGLRYFNVFGPRQDPNGAYAAVIPRWTDAMIRQETVTINGDGTTSRDFCYVANAVQANIRAALADDAAQNEIYNVAVGHQTSLIELFDILRTTLSAYQISYDRPPIYTDFRAGDVHASLADVGKAQKKLGFAPTHSISQGIDEAMEWYVRR